MLQGPEFEHGRSSTGATPRFISIYSRTFGYLLSCMDHVSIEQQFATALDGLIEEIKEDRSILAAILCGSLSHDTVWAKSDIDLVLVTIDDKKVEKSSLALNAGGVNVHAFLMPRTEFRQTIESAVRNSFMHSLLAKGRLL